jgi:DNA-directed RNA polymerase specialized sigma24 family protein
VFLRYFADLDQAAIAKALGVRPGTVAATLHAARESLRESLEEVESWQR